MTLSGWVDELKRRRVFRTLAGYGLVSFALLQVVEPVMHGLALPDWTLKVVVIGLGLGFPIAALLAWAYDIRATGLERTASSGAPSGVARAWRAVALVALGLLLGAPVVAYYLVFRGGTSDGPPAATSGGPSVAVLPFVNMSDDPANEYFSDGLSEEILNAMAQVPGLRVPARTSSFAFKGRSEDVAKIAAALRVATVLEGSVRKAGGRVRITAQLVNAADGYHLWSQTFDRELKDVFAIQDEISTAIADALKVRLAPAPSASARPAGAPTSPDAYEAYLLGRHALNERSRRSIEASIGQFQRATRLDPGFAAAYADQAVATLLLGRSATGYGDVPMDRALAQAAPLVERARALAPGRPEVLAATGFLEHQSGHQARALELYDQALAVNPSNGELRNWRNIALQELGRVDQILAAATDAVKSDPLSRIALINYVPTLETFGRTEEIGPIVERLRSLDEGWGQWALGWLALGRGDRAEAVRHLLPAVQLGRDKAAMDLAANLATLGLREEALRVGSAAPLRVLLALGDFQGALVLAQRAAPQAPQDHEVLAALFLSLYGTGRLAEAADVGARLYATGHGATQHADLLAPMADAARTAGRDAEASTYRDELERLMGLAERAGVVRAHRNGTLAQLAAFDGRDDEAVALLASVVPTFGGSRAELGLHLAGRLAKRADFQAATRQVEATIRSQRAQVVRMLCGPEPIDPSWKPAPETCALHTAVR